MSGVRILLCTLLPLAALIAWLAPSPAPGHRLLHINCPPGSHTMPSDKNGVARKLGEARTQVLEARSLTATHPAAKPQPNAPK